MIELKIDGVPIPWKRPGGRTIRYDTQAKEKEKIRWKIRGDLQKIKQEMLCGPVIVRCMFFFPIPKGTSGVKRRQMLNNTIYHMKKPDIDNCEKFILDCMNGVVYRDDSQIVDLQCKKIYSDYPHTSITVFPAPTKQEYEIDDEGNSRNS